MCLIAQAHGHFKTLPFLILLHSLLILSVQSNIRQVCSPSSFCGSTTDKPHIRFPFRLLPHHHKNSTSTSTSTDRCGYPEFDLSCNNKPTETVIKISNSGNFTIKHIDYRSQLMYVNDPDNCLPKRFLDPPSSSFLMSSQFHAIYRRRFTFLNCSSSANTTSFMPGLVPVSCLGGETYTVMAVPSRFYGGDETVLLASCWVISKVMVPTRRRWSGSFDLNDDVPLSWSVPNCRSCEEEGGVCGFKSNSGLQIGCSNRPAHGLSRGAKYGIIVGVGIPGLLCLIGITCYISGRIKIYTHRRHHRDTELSTIITPQPTAVVVMGLDGSIIESYPKTIVGDGKRLPNPNDDPTCPICLSDYQPKETLRTIPECNHYFHAQCVDEWLKLNATCPLCRNVPDGTSSHITPSSLWSSSSSSSVSPSVHQTTTTVV